MIRLLVSYAYALRGSDREKLDAVLDVPGVHVLVDSGAFTAHTQGVDVNLDDYVAFCRLLGGRAWGYVQLDVVGRPDLTERNLHVMLDAGLSPIPVLTDEAPVDDAPRLAALHPERRLCVAGAARKYPGQPRAYSHRLSEVWRACGGEVMIHGLGYERWPTIFHEPLCSADSSWLIYVGGRYATLVVPKRDGGYHGRTGNVSSRWGIPMSELEPYEVQFLERCDVTADLWHSDPRKTGGEFARLTSWLPALHRSRLCARAGRDLFAVSRIDTSLGGNSIDQMSVCAALSDPDSLAVDYPAAKAVMESMRDMTTRERVDQVERLLAGSRWAEVEPVRPVLVGECPPPDGTGDAGALDGDSGRRLASLVGVDYPQLLSSTDRLNLFDAHQARWSDPDARVAAERLSRRLAGRREVVLLGARVARAFGLPRGHYRWRDRHAWRVASVPHPSGMNRQLNDDAQRARVAAFLAPVLGGEAIGVSS